MNNLNSPSSLHWLPPAHGFSGEISRIWELCRECPEGCFAAMRMLSGHRLDFMQIRRVDRLLSKMTDAVPSDTPRLRLALLGSMTLDHIVPAIRVAALRRGLVVDIELAPYGQWRQQILDPDSSLYAFGPDCVLLAIDAPTLVPDLPLDAAAMQVKMAVDGAVDNLAQLWRLVAERTGAAVIQETPWLDGPSLYGHFERQVPASPGAIMHRLDCALTDRATAEGVLLLDLRSAVSRVGVDNISDRALWHYAKQAVSPAATPWIGDHVARILAAIRGLSKKVLVLDLDNTLWGGVIGDDGLDGIVIGQGSAAGEAFVAFQRYVKQLADRGVVLSVSSKNDPETARSVFAEHPEMVLRLDDFAAFEASWNDKPSALRAMADDLSLGLDTFVFVDDNPAERALVRSVLPQVAVPELPDAPEEYARCLADAGYFEAVSFTAEDSRRNAQYVANRSRRELRSEALDLEGFLHDLQMTLTVVPFRNTDVARITQLINKTNQFNLTTRRYTEAEVRAFMNNPDVVTCAGRLSDRFGDNGLISVVICKSTNDNFEGHGLEIDTWLMSCRVLGRRVENAMLSVMAEKASERGASFLFGRYLPTRKNGMVKDLLSKLGFTLQKIDNDTGESRWVLNLGGAKMPSADHLHLLYE